jgi:N-methylhydantoinase A
VGVVKILGVLEADQRAITTISHGTTVATNQLLEGRIARLGFITTDGYQFVLEIARQSVPDGYGNSYFWVKPDRIVPPDLVRTVRGRLDYTGIELRALRRRTGRCRRSLLRRAPHRNDWCLLPARLCQPVA